MKAYYLIRPLVPRKLQLRVRSYFARRKYYTAVDWPVSEPAGRTPPGWRGWPGASRFALVLTHDVETQWGMERCIRLAALEERLGVRSGFYIVPERYPVYSDVLKELTRRGFEIGVHGLRHDGRLYRSRETFSSRAGRINEYLKLWGASGFRSPSMHHNLAWLHELDIMYDLSTFDTDPFEPQPDGVHTIFPFWVEGEEPGQGYLEMPYTLCQDFSLFVLVGCRDISVWKRKLDWIAERGGMALLDTHPDYMHFGEGTRGRGQYPVELYLEFLEYVCSRYRGGFWNALPVQVCSHVREQAARMENAI